MAKLKLPEELKSWKVISASSDNSGYPSCKISRKEFDGSQTTAKLTVVAYDGDNYNSDNVDLINEEASFVKSVIKLRGVSNYIDAVVDNKPAKSKVSLYLLTEDLPTLKEVLGDRQPDEADIVDFGMKVDAILEKLEQNNILHGNLKPDNIFVAEDGSYRLGGFTAFDNHSDDLTCTAPEIYRNGQPDYTTDIYSLGLMMYTMANNGKLPFEEDGDTASAVEKRLSNAPVTAPANGSEKLKSVIVIACQPENKNRWKNAGNLKNALASIKAELPAKESVNKNVIAPEPTEFESNVFEEYAFEEPVQAPEQPRESKAAAAAVTAAVAGAGAVSAAEAVKASEATPEAAQAFKAPDVPAQAYEAAKPAPDKAEPIPAPSYREPEIDNRVFDNYVPETKVFNINDAVGGGEKDYGDFFDDEPAEEAAPKTEAPVAAVPPVAPQTEEFEGNAFYNTPETEEAEPEKTGKKGVIAAVIIIAVMLAAVAGYGVYAYQNSLFPFGAKEESQSEQTATEAVPVTEAVTQPTSVPATTAPTTKPADSEKVVPTNVTDFSYDYAKMVLEAQGFNVLVSEYQYSDSFENGHVISMSPDDGSPLAKNSTITLVVSMGSENGGSGDNNNDSDDDNDYNDNDNDNYDDNDNDSNDNDNNDGGDNGDGFTETAMSGSAAPAAQPANAARQRSDKTGESTGSGSSGNNSSGNNSSGGSSSGSSNSTRMRVSSDSNYTGNDFSPCKYNTSYLTQSDVSSMSQEELNIAINEIYARRGRIFTNSYLASYFNSQSWYKPLYNESEFYDNVIFNDYESKNVDTIRFEQIKRGYY